MVAKKGIRISDFICITIELMKLRYVFIFALGMACMYRLVRAGLLDIKVIGDRNDTEVIVTTGVIITGQTTGIIDLSATGTSVMSGNTNTGTTQPITGQVSTGQTLQDTWAVKQEPIVQEPVQPVSVSKETACAQGDGTYSTPLQVSWNDTLTATTVSYSKLRNYIHYVVLVSNGQKYYFYHNCSTGVPTNVQNVTATDYTRAVWSNGQIYLR